MLESVSDFWIWNSLESNALNPGGNIQSEMRNRDDGKNSAIREFLPAPRNRDGTIDGNSMQHAHSDVHSTKPRKRASEKEEEKESPVDSFQRQTTVFATALDSDTVIGT